MCFTFHILFAFTICSDRITLRCVIKTSIWSALTILTSCWTKVKMCWFTCLTVLSGHSWFTWALSIFRTALWNQRPLSPQKYVIMYKHHIVFAMNFNNQRNNDLEILRKSRLPVVSHMQSTHGILP